MSEAPTPHAEVDRRRAESPVLEPEQVARIITWARAHPDHWFAGIVSAIAETGMRRGEAFGPRRQDIDLTESTITICGRITKQTRTPAAYGPPKTAAGHRTIWVPRDLAVAVALTRQQQSSQVASLDGLISASDTGAALNPERFSDWWAIRLRRELDLPDWCTPHTLRHTPATLLARAGVPAQDIAGRLGHRIESLPWDERAPSRSLTTYLHRTDAGVCAAARAWEQVMGRSIA